VSKFFKTTYKIVVLSEDDPVETTNLEDLHYHITDGLCSGETTLENTEELTPAEAAKALIAQGSDPGFFLLDEHGDSIDD
jgi:hypothetical protein